MPNQTAGEIPDHDGARLMRLIALNDMKEAMGMIAQAMRDLAVPPKRSARLHVESAIEAAAVYLRKAQGAAVAALVLEGGA